MITWKMLSDVSQVCLSLAIKSRFNIKKGGQVLGMGRRQWGELAPRSSRAPLEATWSAPSSTTRRRDGGRHKLTMAVWPCERVCERNILYAAEVSGLMSLRSNRWKTQIDVHTHTIYCKRVWGLTRKHLSTFGPILAPWGDQTKRSKRNLKWFRWESPRGLGDDLCGHCDIIQYLSEIRARCLV